MVTSRILTCNPDSISFRDPDDVQITCNQTSDSLRTASEHLQKGRLVVLPTETVYGLGALALDASAAAQIFKAKERPADNPLIVHISSIRMLETLLPIDFTLPRTYQSLIKRFWPGPLTLLFPRNPRVIPAIITADQPTFAARMPSHPVARALIAMTGTPIAAPSANTSGKPSPTTAEHVLCDLAGKVEVILDGGACTVGLESTVIDGLHPDGHIHVLRPGGVTVEDIRYALKEDGITADVLVYQRDFEDKTIEAAPTTPGMKYRHYSPAVPVILLISSSPPSGTHVTDFSSFLSSLRIKGKTRKLGIMSANDSRLASYELPSQDLEWIRYNLGSIFNLRLVAQRLFDGFISLERQGVELIIVEGVEEQHEGLAIMNRIRKAASSTHWILLDHGDITMHV